MQPSPLIQKTLSNPSSIPNNATVNASGFDVTDHMLQRFSYGKLGIVYLNLVWSDIIHRGGVVDPKMKVRKTGKCLLKLDLELQRKTYKETAGKDARDENLKSVSFEPVRGTADYDALMQKEWTNEWTNSVT